MTVAGIVLAVVRAARGDGGGLGLGGRIALIEVDGVLGDDRKYLEQIRRLRENRAVKGYVLAINSPGGVVGPAQSLYRELKRLREEDGLPVVASFAGTGASGGYYVALAADSIFALPGSITGSIGVLLEVPNASELMDRVGVSVEVVKSAEQKDAGSPFRPLTPETARCSRTWSWTSTSSSCRWWRKSGTSTPAPCASSRTGVSCPAGRHSSTG